MSTLILALAILALAITQIIMTLRINHLRAEMAAEASQLSSEIAKAVSESAPLFHSHEIHDIVDLPLYLRRDDDRS